jgi:CubicO group peptidase (beta-lactamase class C family)
MLKLLRQLMPGQPSLLLQPAMLAELFTDQLSADQHVQFAHLGRFPSLGFGLAGALTREASALASAAAVGELQWGGLAGTHWFISPATGLAGVVMAQRHWGFWNKFWFRYKARVYEAAG